MYSRALRALGDVGMANRLVMKALRVRAAAAAGLLRFLMRLSQNNESHVDALHEYAKAALTDGLRSDAVQLLLRLIVLSQARACGRARRGVARVTRVRGHADAHARAPVACKDCVH
jgi:hypothetical protein